MPTVLKRGSSLVTEQGSITIQHNYLPLDSVHRMTLLLFIL